MNEPLMSSPAASSGGASGATSGGTSIGASCGTLWGTLWGISLGPGDPGLITRQVDPADRRQAYVRLTPGGTQLVETLLPDFLALEATLLRALTPTQLDDLGTLTARLLDHAEQRGADDPPPRRARRTPG